MPEPVFGSVLLAAFIAEFAKKGADALLELAASHLPSASRQSTGDVFDLVSGARASTRARLRLSVSGCERPYWVLIGLQTDTGDWHQIPALYGEAVDLHVPRRPYDLYSLFMTKPSGFDDKPLLLAIASQHEVLASARLQRVRVLGLPPASEQVEILEAKFPADQLPFRFKSPGPARRIASITPMPARVIPPSSRSTSLPRSRSALPPPSAPRPSVERRAFFELEIPTTGSVGPAGPVRYREPNDDYRRDVLRDLDSARTYSTRGSGTVSYRLESGSESGADAYIRTDRKCYPVIVIDDRNWLGSLDRYIAALPARAADGILCITNVFNIKVGLRRAGNKNLYVLYIRHPGANLGRIHHAIGQLESAW